MKLTTTGIAWAVVSNIKGYEGIIESVKNGQLAIYSSRSKARIVASSMDNVSVMPVRITPKRK